MAQVEVTNVTVSQGVRMLFSLMTPNESSFATVREVPTYVNQVRVTFIYLFLQKDSEPQSLSDYMDNISITPNTPHPPTPPPKTVTYIYLYLFNYTHTHARMYKLVGTGRL